MEPGHARGARLEAFALPPVSVFNADGRGAYVLTCDHASNRIPDAFGGLGLSPIEQLRHIAWDPGALAVSQQLSAALDAPLVCSTVSRLVVDCNRAPDAPDLIPVRSEDTDIPGNVGIGRAERARRIERYHSPFHSAVAELLQSRKAAGMRTLLISVHSFTPVYRGVSRPWPIGLIPGRDPRLTKALFAALEADAPELKIGWNEPYAANAGSTYTLEHHGDEGGLDATMIEIRHDEILTPDGVAAWSARLVRTLMEAGRSFDGRSS